MRCLPMLKRFSTRFMTGLSIRLLLASMKFFASLLLGVPIFALAGNLAYITNQGSDSVSVLDIASKQVTRTIAVGKAPVGVAIAPKKQRVYISNANSQTVSVINSATQQTVQEIPVNAQAVGIALSRDEKTLYVADWGGEQVIAVDTAHPENSKPSKRAKPLPACWSVQITKSCLSPTATVTMSPWSIPKP